MKKTSIMKKTSTLKKSLAVVLSVATISMASVSASQAATSMSEIAAASQSKISLEQALTLANKAVKGDIISVDFDQEDRAENSHYDIKMIANNNEQEVRVNANTGKVTKDETERLDKEDLAEYNIMKQAKVSLSQAIKNANKTLKGTVLEAEFDMDFGKPVYKIEIGKGNQVHKVVVDSMTGKITSSQVDNDD
ncbi:PepSY domain-containing protein [Psychrobacter sp. JB193]|uniref:PepSY domain-containing protein n=1 Tax=Psychrobacter sp. JB193 TaxID=2024406 RepID=UPI00211C320E|nr:PepSY domain-containing protein [Psychrobacter sp. JB193]